MGLGSTVNPNLKGDCSVTVFTKAAGLDVQGFPEYLSGIVASGNELGTLTNEQWQQILGPMELSGERAARATTAIAEIRAQYAKEAAGLEEKNLHNHLVNGGYHPHARPGAEVYEPKLNGARPKATEDSFIGVPFFQGEQPGWTFKHGDEGLGYYRDAVAATGGGPAPPIVTNVARGYGPVSQAGLEDMVARQQVSYTQSRQQQLLSERRQRMDERRHSYSQADAAKMYADARTRSSPFATAY